MSAQEFVPAGADLDRLRDAADGCRGCELWEPATQTVFSAGRPDARLVLVGEQPGDVEDQKGQPFVGPAGRLLVRAVDEAGIDRDITYRTNAVKSQLGPAVRVTQDRGAIMQRDTSLGPRQFLVTIHPSAVLRADDRDAAYAGLVADLKVAAAAL